MPHCGGSANIRVPTGPHRWDGWLRQFTPFFTALLMGSPLITELYIPGFKLRAVTRCRDTTPHFWLLHSCWITALPRHHSCRFPNALLVPPFAPWFPPILTCRLDVYRFFCTPVRRVAGPCRQQLCGSPWRLRPTRFLPYSLGAGCLPTLPDERTVPCQRQTRCANGMTPALPPPALPHHWIGYACYLCYALAAPPAAVLRPAALLV